MNVRKCSINWTSVAHLGEHYSIAAPSWRNRRAG